MWKCEYITMDFITKLPNTAKGFDAIWVIMDLLTKSAHFFAIRESSLAKKLTDMYVRDIFVCRGVLVFIVSDRDVRFTSYFEQKFHDKLGTR